jgi:hypothetical protein
LGRVWRIAIAVALLLPLGFVMGMPMPSGIPILANAVPELAPWAWGNRDYQIYQSAAKEIRQE